MKHLLLSHLLLKKFLWFFCLVCFFT